MIYADNAATTAVNLTILPDNKTIYQYTKENKTRRITFYRIRKYWDYANAEQNEGITVSVQNQYIICILIVASGQGGIVFVWDTEKNCIVHLSEASYAVKSIVAEGNVISLCHVAHYGTRPYFTLICSEFNTIDVWKEPKSLVVEGIEDDLDNEYSLDNYTLCMDGNNLICGYKTQVCTYAPEELGIVRAENDSWK